MKTTIELTDYDGYLVVDEIERANGKLNLICKYMSVCVAIDLYSQGVIERFIMLEGGGCVMTIDVDRICKVYSNEED